MAVLTIDEALAHADVHAVPGHAQSLLAAEVRRLSGQLDESFIRETNLSAENLRLIAEITGPDGFETWRDAAVAERVRRKAAEDERDRYKHLLFARSESSSGWVGVADGLPEKSEDVLVTILIDGIDADWKAGFWDGEYWYTRDTEHDEPVEVNDGCNFVVTHWARVNPAEQGLTDE